MNILQIVCLRICEMIFTKIWLFEIFQPSSVDAISFGCVVILSLYLTLNSVISSLFVGTFKSVCKTLLDAYHRAFTMVRGT
jgi:hypothetical protein